MSAMGVVITNAVERSLEQGRRVFVIETSMQGQAYRHVERFNHLHEARRRLDGIVWAMRQGYFTRAHVQRSPSWLPVPEIVGTPVPYAPTLH